MVDNIFGVLFLNSTGNQEHLVNGIVCVGIWTFMKNFILRVDQHLIYGVIWIGEKSVCPWCHVKLAHEGTHIIGDVFWKLES